MAFSTYNKAYMGHWQNFNTCSMDNCFTTNSLYCKYMSLGFMSPVIPVTLLTHVPVRTHLWHPVLPWDGLKFNTEYNADV